MSIPAFKDHELDDNRAALSPDLPTPAGRAAPLLRRLDPAAIAKAEAALKGLASQFGQWLQAEVDKLQAACAAVHAEGLTGATADRLYACAHDLKGLGTTYEFPIITRMAGSLCTLLGEGERRMDTPTALLDAHVDAIVACLRDDIRDVDTPVGRLRVEQLERAVAARVSG